MKVRTLLAALAAVISALSLAGTALAKDPVYTGRFSNEAVNGYDPVAFFTEGRPVEGSDQFIYEFNGATWKFSSQANLDTFKDDPIAYAPQYGGYCAWAMAKGQFASGSPKHWTIVDNKLYLNYNASVQKKWEKDIPGFIEQADAEWPAAIG